MALSRTWLLPAALIVAFGLGKWSAAGGAGAQQTGPYARFAFSGYHHSGSLVVNAQGYGNFTYRTYVNCTKTIVTGCDMFLGKYIYSGGFVIFRLSKVNGNRATGYITNAAFSWQVNTTVTLTFNSAKDTMTISAPGVQYTNCGPRAPAGYCGA